MTELYIAGRDAYVAGNLATKKVKGRSRLPAYAEASRPRKPGLSGKALWDAVDRMASRLN